MHRVPSCTKPAPAHGLVESGCGRALQAGLAGLAAAAFALSGCGGGDAEKGGSESAGSGSQSAPAANPDDVAAINAANDGAYTALKAADGAAFCALLSEESIKVLVAGNREKGTAEAKCAKVATKIAKSAQPGAIKPQKLTDIRVTGDTATGVAAGRRTTFERVSGRWLIGASQDMQASSPAKTTP